MNGLAFQYQAIDRKGGKTRGVLRAENSKEAYRQVCAAGLQPVRISQLRVRRARSRRVTVKDLAHFTHQLAVLMQARIPIVDGLRSIGEQEGNPRLRGVIYDVANRLAAGASITEALASHRELFGDVYVETIRAAEQTGNMTEVLTNLSDMLDREYELRKNVKGALMYPMCVVIALILAVSFLTVVVVPQFARMFSDRGVDLPLPTRMLLGLSVFVRTWWVLLVGSAIVGGWSLRQVWVGKKGRGRIDRLLHRVPLVAEVLRGLALSRFSQVLGISLRSGLSLIEALDMAGRASARPMLMDDTERMRDRVKQGGRLADVLLTCSYIPSFTRRMMTAGEEASELPRMCTVVSRHYDREVTHLTKNVTAVIEPIMIVALAGVVLIVALAIFMPMWNMASLIG